MSDLQDDLPQKWAEYIRQGLAAKGPGSATKLAKHMGWGKDIPTRIMNLNPKKQRRRIQPEEFQALQDFFGKAPPGAVVENQALEHPAGRSMQRIPLLKASVSAGKLLSSYAQATKETSKSITLSGLGNGDFFAIEVKGDSMDRVAPEGAIIVVNRADRDLRDGGYYVFMIGGETTFKKWHNDDPPMLVPDSTNPTHKPRLIKRKRELEVIGRVKRSIIDL